MKNRQQRLDRSLEWDGLEGHCGQMFWAQPKTLFWCNSMEDVSNGQETLGMAAGHTLKKKPDKLSFAWGGLGYKTG
jgi:hypothetical protein